MLRNLKMVVAAIAAALLLTADANKSFAAAASNNLTISATIGANCAITAQPLAAFAYDPVVAHKTSNFTNQLNSVQYTCTSGTTPISITLDQGAHACAAAAGGCPAVSTSAAPARQMLNGANLLYYNIFSSSTSQSTGTPGTAWGTANGPTMAAGTGAQQTFTLFITIPANQQLPAGTYTDIVSQTINF